jgi:chromosome segregation ATPase
VTHSEQREAEVKERHRKKLHKAQDLQSEVNSLKDSLEQSSEEKSELDAEIDSTNAQITQLEKELQEQQNKLQRALNLLRKCNKSLKMKFHISDREQSIIEQDVSLQFLKKKNEYALFSLAQLVQLYPQLREDLETELAEANLQLRSRPPSAGSHPGNNQQKQTTLTLL